MTVAVLTVVASLLLVLGEVASGQSFVVGDHLDQQIAALVGDHLFPWAVGHVEDLVACHFRPVLVGLEAEIGLGVVGL